MPPRFSAGPTTSIHRPIRQFVCKLVDCASSCYDYYSHEGLADTIVVEMPNGSYSLNFHHREIAASGHRCLVPQIFLAG